jgi:hypothetical protein
MEDPARGREVPIAVDDTSSHRCAALSQAVARRATAACDYGRTTSTEEIDSAAALIKFLASGSGRELWQDPLRPADDPHHHRPIPPRLADTRDQLALSSFFEGIKNAVICLRMSRRFARSCTSPACASRAANGRKSPPHLRDGPGRLKRFRGTCGARRPAQGDRGHFREDQLGSSTLSTTWITPFD